MLNELFNVIKDANDDNRIVYSEDYMFAKEGTAQRDLYELVSDIAHATGLSHGFSYEIVSRAVDVLVSLDEQEQDLDIAGIDEAVDAIVPVYNHTLLLIANPSDYHHIDEAREVHGNEVDTITACAYAWYSLIDNAARDIHDAIVEYNDNNA